MIKVYDRCSSSLLAQTLESQSTSKQHEEYLWGSLPPSGVIIFLVGSVVKFVFVEKRDFQQVVFAKTDAVI